MRKYIKQLLKEAKEEKRQSSVGALSYDGEILILKRGSTAPWMPNKWSLVGGGIDDGETAMVAMERESEEEIGQVPVNLRWLEEIDTPEGIEHFFYGELQHNNIKLNWENSEYAFVSLDTINNYAFVPNARNFIEHFLKSM